MENNEKGVAADGRQKVKKHNQTKKKNSDKGNASQRAFVKGLRNRPTGGPTLTYDPRRRRVPAYFLFPIIEPCFSIILSVFINIHIVR